jgi:cell division initiation protein
MPITPQEIQDREFREAFRGYNQDDVDTFLDEVAVEFGRLYQENQRMKVQLAALQQEVARLADAKDRAPAAAVVAPGQDDTHVEAARKAADVALDEAKRRASEVVQRAEQRAREIDELTARRAKDVDSDASAALTDAQQRVGDLRRQEAELRRRIRTFLEQQLAAMETVDLDPDRSTGSHPSGAAVVEPVSDRMARELAQEPPASPTPEPATAGELPFWSAE